ncbi:tigger transposable element-derived protein 4 [Parasteatoda tepidariorum]|uniref:tigger transposable element-derived protein 4 n=1 Tax=Parasteatoda tepidariorum TaxID=114398 RepID=UPI0039BCA9C3
MATDIRSKMSKFPIMLEPHFESHILWNFVGKNLLQNDQIIRNIQPGWLKVFYRKQLVRKAVAELENGNLNDACKLKLSVLEAMHFISAAWRSVTQKRISHCFEESGIVASNEPLADAGLARLDPENDNETVSYDFDEYIRENLATCEAERTTAPSVDDVMDFSSADEDEQEGTEAQPVPSFNTALRSLLIVKDYFLSYEDQEKNLQKISVLEDEAFTLNSMSKKQSTITHYFAPKLHDS